MFRAIFIRFPIYWNKMIITWMKRIVCLTTIMITIKLVVNFNNNKVSSSNNNLVRILIVEGRII